MRVLIVKMSSMGDLIHTLPALTDAQKAIPDIKFDWVAEERFVEIPKWHPAVDEVMPIAIRRWRKNIVSSFSQGELFKFVKKIKHHQYDYLIDAQGLIKSAMVMTLAKGVHCGMDNQSCKESLAALFYRNKVSIIKQAHAIERVRILFASILDYQYEKKSLNYGLTSSLFSNGNLQTPYLVFLHGTSGDNKLWPVEQWIALRDIALTNGYTIYIPWGNETEKTRAEVIAGEIDTCHVLPKMNLTEMAGILANASGVVGVDTGLAHLAAALSIPAITIYVDTYPELTGACGTNQLCISTQQTDDSTINTAGLKSVYCEQLLAKEVWHLLVANL